MKNDIIEDLDTIIDNRWTEIKKGIFFTYNHSGTLTLLIFLFHYHRCTVSL